jgi:hypothetical protein
LLAAEVAGTKSAAAVEAVESSMNLVSSLNRDRSSQYTWGMAEMGLLAQTFLRTMERILGLANFMFAEVVVVEETTTSTVMDVIMVED